MFYGFDLAVPPTRIPGVDWLCVMIFKWNQGKSAGKKSENCFIIQQKHVFGRGVGNQDQTYHIGSLQTIDTSLI